MHLLILKNLNLLIINKKFELVMIQFEDFNHFFMEKIQKLMNLFINK